MPKQAPNARADRAKQFMPFAALRGYYDLVADAARYREDKRDLLSDRQDQLDAVLGSLKQGDYITVCHYHEDIYQTTTGTLDAINELDKTLVVNGISIRADDVYSIESTASSDPE